VSSAIFFATVSCRFFKVQLCRFKISESLFLVQLRRGSFRYVEIEVEHVNYEREIYSIRTSSLLVDRSCAGPCCFRTNILRMSIVFLGDISGGRTIELDRLRFCRIPRTAIAAVCTMEGLL